MTTDTRHDDAELDRYGYRQQFVRSLRHFESFAVAFSFISITTGIFTTYGFALAAGGPRSIWTWVIVVAGQSLVALVYGALATRVPLSGYSYQWASRLANAGVGWWLGWMSFAFLSIVTVSVDYGLVEVAFQPLIGEAFTPTSAALETLVVLARDETHRIRGVLHFVPCYGRPAVSLSFMRRDPATPNGLTEFLVASAAELLRDRGVRELSLNFATFARWMHSPGRWHEHVLGKLVALGNPFFQIESLYRFNAKFFPRWEPRYLVYEGPLGLPRASIAAMWAEGQVWKPGAARRQAA